MIGNRQHPLALRQLRQREHGRTDSTRWACPVCATSVPHPHRPGRRRVYCTNSCKQRAYRWRHRHHGELAAPQPPERAWSRDRTHAMRSHDDLVTPLLHTTMPPPRTQRVTACGTFARAAFDTPDLFAHTKFYPAASSDEPDGIAPGICRTCISVLGVPVDSMAVILRRLGVSTLPRAA